VEFCRKMKFVTDFDEPHVCGPSEILPSSFCLHPSLGGPSYPVKPLKIMAGNKNKVKSVKMS